MSDVVSILMRLRGGREAKADADAVAGSLERTGAAAEAANQRAARGAVSAERATKRHTGAVLGLATTAKYAARQYAVFAGPAAIGAVAALGIRFDATMEQNRVAMTHFLG